MTSYYSPRCVHPGNELLWTCGNGLEVYAGARTDLDQTYGVILDCSGITPRASDNPVTLHGNDTELFEPLRALYVPQRRVCIDWRDGSDPPVTGAFWNEFLHLAGTLNPKSVCVCCVGGHGRTGTALAALFMESHRDLTLTQAVEFLRAMHCEDAVETDAQRRYLVALCNARGWKVGAGFEPSYWTRQSTYKAPATTTGTGANVPIAQTAVRPITVAEYDKEQEQAGSKRHNRKTRKQRKAERAAALLKGSNGAGGAPRVGDWPDDGDDDYITAPPKGTRWSFDLQRYVPIEEDDDTEGTLPPGML